MYDRRSLDYPALAKWGFLLGVALVVIGGLGELIGHALYGSLPAWEATLFFDMEVVGILLGLVSPFLFGVLLPLIE